MISVLTSLLVLTAAPQDPTQPAPGTSQVLERSQASDWREIAPENLLIMTVAGGEVFIELAPAFAPLHVENLRTLAREHWFDGSAINRVQDNYVVQWGDYAYRASSVARTVEPEFDRSAEGLAFTPLPRSSAYGEEGHSDSWPATRAEGRAWLSHCYGMVGAGRDEAADTGSGHELFVVIGQARHLDRNDALLGRVVEGIEHLSSLPRGSGALGVYPNAEQNVPIRSIVLASELPSETRPRFEVLRDGTSTWTAYVDARAHRTRDGWFLADAGHVDLCNLRIPVRRITP